MTAQGLARVAGVDEAGRGPLAGPVYAAAVMLDPDRAIPGLDDSKRVSPARREVLAELIRADALAWGIGVAEVEEIDEINILQATKLAMVRAVEVLPGCEGLLIDGNQSLQLALPQLTVVKGDQRCPAISAASILAKTSRDAHMLDLDRRFPGYGFARHKGYGTAQHLEALRRLGASAAHRSSFAPVRAVLEARGG
jgi:ribonuclease HII